MPQSKGRVPSHQNAFAFRHNPKSKLTEKIAAMPIRGLCRRCRDKIEWRKKYRKYKPLTQPSKCNTCGKRNVNAAYHTICEGCASKDKVCEMCTKEKQIKDPREEDTEEHQKMMITGMRKMKLREKRSLERKLAKAENIEYDESQSCTEDENQ